MKVPTPKDIFSLKYIFVPININNKHWTLAVIFMEAKKIQYYDSCGGTDWGKMQGLLEYVKDEYRALHDGEEMDAKEWELVPCKSDTPRQKNGKFHLKDSACQMSRNSVFHTLASPLTLLPLLLVLTLVFSYACFPTSFQWTVLLFLTKITLITVGI